MIRICVITVSIGWVVLFGMDMANGFPKTCHEVQMSGGSEGYHTIDPEQDGIGPISVFCNMTSSPVTAVLHHNLESWTHVSGYEDAYSYNGQLVYGNGVTLDQVRGLIFASTQCSYFIHMTCQGIAQGCCTYWQSYYGRVNQWETLGGSFCQQESGEVQCRCESPTDNAWNGFNIGDAGNWPLFPIESLRLGDTGGSNEYIDFKVGPLVCKQGQTLRRRFVQMKDIRQNANIIGIRNIYSVVQCGVECIRKARDCVGFNFQRGPPVMCELTGVPHDAPTANMAPNPTWDHYPIIP